MKPTLPMLEQLESYCDWAERDGTYYGSKKHFDKRHKKILAYLLELKNEIVSK